MKPKERAAVSANGAIDLELRELRQLRQLTEALLAQVRSDAIDISVSDAYGREVVLNDHPVTGCKRVLAYRTGNGWASFTAQTSPGSLLLAANEARLGLTITNTGTNQVLLYLADQPRSGVLVISLAAGASWDGRVGNLLWGGNVWAVAQTGTTTLAGGEL